MGREIAIIGAGITGLACGQMLRNTCGVTLFERSASPGGLIKCSRVKDCLFHRVGGHVFNSRVPEVHEWFWTFFDRGGEFVSAKRNAQILLAGKLIGYPIENHLWQLPDAIAENIVADLLAIQESRFRQQKPPPQTLAEFLQQTFGATLCRIYFDPYNEKLWPVPLTQVPLDWLEGKLPMPEMAGIFLANILKREERQMVHSTFFYPREGGSQFIADRLAGGLSIKLETAIEKLSYCGRGWEVNGKHFDAVIYTGDLRQLARIVEHPDAAVQVALQSATGMKSAGTSNMFCEADTTDISWLYLPDPGIAAHRIIYTGGFTESNNRGSDRMTCVVEFAGYQSLDCMKSHLSKLPGNLVYLDHNHESTSYVFQDSSTRSLIGHVRNTLQQAGLFLAGRFAEWEYYNMDKAIESAMRVVGQIAR